MSFEDNGEGLGEALEDEEVDAPEDLEQVRIVRKD